MKTRTSVNPATQMTNSVNLISQERKQLLDMFASQALNALISKMPFYDDKGEFGKKVTSDELQTIKKGVVATAYEYAALMILERENQLDWLQKNTHYLNERSESRKQSKK